MRVYYKIDENIAKDEDELSGLTGALNGIENEVHRHMMEKMKFQIMWALRSLEEEMNNSEGRIIIEWKSLRDKLKVYPENFDNELLQKVMAIASKTKLG